LKKIVFFFLISVSVFAQTGIGTTTPNASAKLDVYSTNKGFLPPRVTLISTTDASTIVSPAEGLLVYNLGSVGLQAGYYFWNGANWATIATATSAGNGVTSMDMVKLYGEAHSKASGKIGNSTTGFVFSVPVSGRYLFDFTSAATTLYGGTNTINFTVRQGTTVLASDMQSSYNNNVHVEYNGKVEVNLQAGVSYNVYNYASSGSFEASDYDRVYYKMVAGNLPVTGQSVEYGIARYTGADGGSLTTGALVSFDATAPGNLTWSGNKFTLKANKTYELESYLAIYQSVGWVSGIFQIYDYTNNAALANGLYMSMQGNAAFNPNANGLMRAIITPTSDIQVGIKFVSFSGATYAPGLIGSANTVTSAAPNQCYFLAKQIGSSAIVNPWVLSGSDSYNTTGKVGIGTNSPTSTLDVTGNINVTGKINVTDPSGNVVVKAAGFVNESVPVTLGDIQIQMAPNGQARSLQIKTTGTSFTGMVTAYTAYNGASGTNAFTHFSDITQTINSTFAHLGATWGFAQSGDVANYFLRDTTNLRFYRITLMVGPSFNTNFISIERLL
jgi:hypothetical protein